ncbi:MAG: hypothetical protein CLLPBCKN_007031 [Chroococcidiopsis cubana SAG 39.79]|uniref:Transposase IS701-like DDE domain-containing protein n=1 Tax=Chroococcidiopsis cubana SAG 39.79 TaxID=388085 RepID=A0AB37U9N7_9CYAN|nr:hypothetical protein [Chroococcidiopsis cubana SAG 39.79]PSB60325.1 hypothetical protein C7B79_26165 [Chroococcidiopsis cubana CCALA 043]RUT00710.1 hypothetical protein DSM107010_67060 [Chroococcidiopsis cubana SAG 39.79]
MFFSIKFCQSPERLHHKSEIAKTVGLNNEQGLLHFLTESPWKASKLGEERLKLILLVLAGRELVLIIDEIGDRKKGDATDYVKRQ